MLLDLGSGAPDALQFDFREWDGPVDIAPFAVGGASLAYTGGTGPTPSTGSDGPAQGVAKVTFTGTLVPAPGGLWIPTEIFLPSARRSGTPFLVDRMV